MEVLTEKVTEIKTFNQLINICDLLKKYHDEFKNIINLVDNETENTKYEHDLKYQHDLIYKKHNEYYNKLGLNNLELTENENEIDNNLTELIEHLENHNLNYIYELENFYYFGYYMETFKDYNIYIDSFNHIIIDFENKEIYNLTENTTYDIIERLLYENETEIINNHEINLKYTEWINKNTNLFLVNCIDNRNQYKDILILKNCEKYERTDNYIKYNLIFDKWKTTNELEQINISELMEQIENENDLFITLLIDIL